MKLTAEEKYRYSRHLLLQEVGLEGQEKLKQAKVLVIGAGGLGCPVLLYLAAAGVGTIGVIDFDTIDASNLQRQILFSANDVGRSKAEVAKEKLNANNPFIDVRAYNEELTNKNALEIFSTFDIIVDGTDNFYTRYMVNDACLIANKPLVYGAIHKFEGQVSVFNYQEGPTYRCLFPSPPKTGSIPSCSEVGVVGVLPGIIGTQQANEVIKIILGIGKVLSGRLLIYNALQSSFMEIKINKTVVEVFNKEEFLKFDYKGYCDVSIGMEKGITLEELANLSSDIFVVDVRGVWEQPQLENKRILHAPLQEIDDYVKEIPTDKKVYVICQHGVRSKVAIEYLEKEYNFTNLINIEGGMLG
jgi:sulfur-carrier protein adenylyltransferase/sulfurtransferase